MTWLPAAIAAFLLGCAASAAFFYQRLSGARNRENSLLKRSLEAEARLTATNEQLELERNLQNTNQGALREAFSALSGEALKSNNEAFLTLAKTSIESLLETAKSDIGEKTHTLQALLKPLETALDKYEKEIKSLETSRGEEYGGLKTLIGQLQAAEADLRSETGNLVAALRRPEVRGQWGQMTLRRVVELSGMSEHCDFSEEVHVATEEGALRPDMLVHLPQDREIVVDSKVPLDAYLDAIAAKDDASRAEALKRHAQQVRNHMRGLSSKNYWQQFAKAPQFVAMFIPQESFLSAAAIIDPALIEDGIKDSVIVATPTTLIALLRAVAYGWRQEKLVKHAEEIADLAKDLYRRFGPFMEHINTTGGHLAKSVAAFNKMVGSLERKVLPSIRKFKDLGAVADDELDEVLPIEQIPVTEIEPQKLDAGS